MTSLKQHLTIFQKSNENVKSLKLFLNSRTLNEQESIELVQYYSSLTHVQQVQLRDSLEHVSLSHSQMLIHEQVCFERAIGAFCLLGHIQSASFGIVRHSTRTTNPPTLSTLPRESEYEQRRHGGVRFGKHSIPLDVFTNLILSFHGDGITDLAPLCLINKDVAHVIGNSATGILLCAHKVNWNVQRCKSNQSNPYTLLLNHNTSLSELCVSGPYGTFSESFPELTCAATQLRVLKVTRAWHHPMTGKKNISSFTCLHTLSLQLQYDRDVKVLESLTNLKHLYLELCPGRPIEIPVDINLPLESLHLTTHYRVGRLATTLRKLTLVCAAEGAFELDLPHLEWLELGGNVHKESVVHLISSHTRLVHLAYFAIPRLDLDLKCLPQTVTSLHINECVAKWDDRTFQDLHCTFCDSLPQDLKVTRHALFYVNTVHCLAQVIDRFPHAKLSVFSSSYFDVTAVTKTMRRSFFMFNGMRVKSDRIVVSGGEEVPYTRYLDKTSIRTLF